MVHNDELSLANEILGWLCINAQPVNDVVTEIYGGTNTDAYTKACINIKNNLLKANKPYGYGGYTTGPATTLTYNTNLATHTPGEIEKALEMLKATNRIMQLGTGKGQGTIILSDTLIGTTEYVEKSIGSNDALGLSKALRDAVSSLVQDNKYLKDRILIYEQELNKIRQQRDKLVADASNKIRTSWT